MMPSGGISALRVEADGLILEPDSELDSVLVSQLRGSWVI